ncbi:hypothetical protein [Bacillus cereus]|uniref:hypothetical protein n=1 Tax=Bacillus cereus TaxID=1396 RepID=UPI003814D935
MPRRAFLLIGMPMKGSPIALEFHNQLLNIEEKVSVKIKFTDVNKEKELAMEMCIAIANRNLVSQAEANANMVTFKMNGKKMFSLLQLLLNDSMKWRIN